MSFGSLYDDERLKMTLPRLCAYCGSDDRLSLDHLIPRSKTGKDDAGNIVWACRACNSSKCNLDMLRWMANRGEFPSVYVLRRYMKVVTLMCDELGLLDCSLDALSEHSLPFNLDLLPYAFPPLETLVLWKVAAQSESGVHGV